MINQGPKQTESEETNMSSDMILCIMSAITLSVRMINLI